MKPRYQLVNDPIFYGMMLLFVVITTLPALLFAMQRLMPILQTITLTIFVLVALRGGQWRQSIAILTLWLGAQIAIVAGVTLLLGDVVDRAFNDGFNYRMMLGEWFFGQGELLSKWQNQPGSRLIELIAVSAGSLLSGGSIGVWCLVREVNLAGYSIGILWRESFSLLIGLLAGFPLWNLLRIAGYIGWVAGLGSFIFESERSIPLLLRRNARLLLLASGFVLTGIVLELFLPNVWRTALARR